MKLRSTVLKTLTITYMYQQRSVQMLNTIIKNDEKKHEQNSFCE